MKYSLRTLCLFQWACAFFMAFILDPQMLSWDHLHWEPGWFRSFSFMCSAALLIFCSYASILLDEVDQ